MSNDLTSNTYAPGMETSTPIDAKVQAIFSVAYDIKSGKWTTTHREKCDLQSAARVVMSCEEVSPEVIFLWAALVPHVHDIAGVDPRAWESMEITAIEFPISSAGEDTVKIKAKNPGAFCTVPLTLPIKWYNLPASTQELLKGLNLALVVFLEERLALAQAAQIQEQLTLFPLAARAKGESCVTISVGSSPVARDESGNVPQDVPESVEEPTPSPAVAPVSAEAPKRKPSKAANALPQSREDLLVAFDAELSDDGTDIFGDAA
jgi:hypothetical protein